MRKGEIRDFLRREWRATRRRRPGASIGIDLDGDLIRLAQITVGKDHKPILQRTRTVNLRDVIDENSSINLDRIIREWRLFEHRIVTFLPRDVLTVKRITLPAIAPDELKRTAVFEACRYLPRAPEEVLADILVLHNTGGPAEGWLYATQQTQVSALTDLFDRINLEPSQIEASSIALARVLGREEAAIVPYCFIGQQRVDILIKQGDSILFSRGLVRGPYIEDIRGLCAEIGRTVEYAERSENLGSLGKIHFLSDQGTLDEISSAGMKDLEIVSECPTEGWVAKDKTEKISAVYAPAIGAALAGADSINLFPFKLTERRNQRQKMRGHLLTALIACSLIALTIINIDRYLAGASEYLNEKRQMLKSLENKTKDLRVLEQQSSALSMHLNTQSDPIEIYSELFRLIPEKILITQMELDRGILILKGQTQQYTLVWKMLDSLNSSSLLDQTAIQFASSRSVQGTPVVDFSVKAHIVTEAKLPHGPA